MNLIANVMPDYVVNLIFFVTSENMRHCAGLPVPQRSMQRQISVSLVWGYGTLGRMWKHEATSCGKAFGEFEQCLEGCALLGQHPKGGAHAQPASTIHPVNNRKLLKFAVYC